MLESIVTVRAARPDDADSLVSLWREQTDTLSKLDPRIQMATDGSERWRAVFLNGLTQTDQYAVVSERANKLVAFMIGTIADNDPGLLPLQIGRITELVVDSHGRGGRIGTEMFLALSTWFSTRGITRIEVHVPARNPIAQAFWRAMGGTELYHEMWIKPRV